MKKKNVQADIATIHVDLLSMGPVKTHTPLNLADIGPD